MSGDCLATSFLGGFNPGAVVMTWLGLWWILGGVFLVAVYRRVGGGSVLADVGYCPGGLAAPGWVQGGLGVLGVLRLPAVALAEPWWPKWWWQRSKLLRHPHRPQGAISQDAACCCTQPHSSGGSG